MRIENAHLVKVIQEKNENDKTALRGEYEDLIAQIRQEYQAQKNEMRDQMKKLELELQLRQKDFKEMRADLEGDISQRKAHISRLE